MGDGYLPADTAPRDMTDVVHGVVNVPISKKRINADGTAVIGGVFSNADIQTEFFYRELALFAEDDSGAEVLYCYGNAGDFAEKITPVGGSDVIEKTIDIVTAIGTAANVTATIVRSTTADEISYNDSVSGIGADSVQEVIEILAAQGVNKIPVILISEAEPTEPCEIWLKPTGQSTIDPASPGDIEDPDNPTDPETPAAPIYFFLAHYYDKVNRVFVPFMETNTAQNIFLTPGSAESIADAITQLQSGRAYIATELYAHIGDMGLHTQPGQMDNINTAMGELVLHVEDMDIHVTAADKARWTEGADTADEALTLAGTASENANQYETRLARIEDSLFNNITGNPFTVAFDSLSGLNLVKGIWNNERARVEC
jgi:hypothetical protein